MSGSPKIWLAHPAFGAATAVHGTCSMMSPKAAARALEGSAAMRIGSSPSRTFGSGLPVR